ncbi:MAG: glycosyltransferase family protein [Arthrobacter sp.]
MSLGTDVSPRVVAVIQARMGSSRLPRKVLRPLGARSVLSWVIRAAQQAPGIDQVVVATSASPLDDPIAEFAATEDVAVVRGSEHDVLDRFIQASRQTGADAVVRLTADCPLLDPAVIGQVVALWRLNPSLDYVSTTLDRSLPRGLDVELARASALEECSSRSEPHHRAHVTSAIYEAGSGFSQASLTFRPGSEKYRVTLDVDDDARLLDALVELLPDAAPSWNTIVQLLNEHPEIVAINEDVTQKALTEG